jgi:hypothetical protein
MNSDMNKAFDLTQEPDPYATPMARADSGRAACWLGG